MSLAFITKIDEDLKRSMSAKDAERTSVLRMLKSALKYAAIEKKKDALDDAEAIQVIQKQLKQRRESAAQFTSGGRVDLAKKEEREAAILESYLPQQLSDAELSILIEKEVQAAQATSKKDFGRVMKLLNEKLAGQAEPKRISDKLGQVLK